MFEHGMDLRRRRVFIQCGIEEGLTPGLNVAEQATRGMLFLDKTEGDIECWINTPGGDVDHMFAIYDIMRACENDIVTIGHGAVASAGALILAGGAPGKRYATPNCIYMVHEFQEGVSAGGTREQEIQLKQKQLAEERWAKLMGKASGRKRTAKYWLSKIRSEPEFWLDAKGMLSHGVIDEVWPPEDD
jgi:ATP-dependent Clp protease protease subunit